MLGSGKVQMDGSDRRQLPAGRVLVRVRVRLVAAEVESELCRGCWWRPAVLPEALVVACVEVADGEEEPVFPRKVLGDFSALGSVRGSVGRLSRA